MAKRAMHAMKNVYVANATDQQVEISERMQAKKIGKRARYGKIETLRAKASHCSGTNSIMSKSISVEDAAT